MEITICEIHNCLHHIIDIFVYILSKNNIKIKITYNIQNDNEIWMGIFNEGNTPNKYIMINTEPLNVDYWKNILEHLPKIVCGTGPQQVKPSLLF